MSNSIPKTSGIYKITCTANGKIYIGSSVNIQQRWNEHRSDLNRNQHDNQHLQNAWNLYSEDAFAFDVIEYVMPFMLIDREQYWLDTLQSHNKKIGFNIALKAGSTLGVTPSEETRRKLSIAGKGRIVSEETRAKISAINKGRKFKPEQIAHMSAAKKGIKQSPESNAKRSATLKGRKRSQESIQKTADGLRGKPKSPEHREKMRLANLGKRPSPESIAKSATSRRGLKQSEETKLKRSLSNSKKYIVVNPNGDEMHIKGLAKFCRENGLDTSMMVKVAKGKNSSHKGWKCKYERND